MRAGWTCYLVFNKNGVSRMTKSEPGLSSGEYAVKVRIVIPHS